MTGLAEGGLSQKSLAEPQISEVRAREESQAGKALVPDAVCKGTPKHHIVWIDTIFIQLLKIDPSHPVEQNTINNCK